MIDIKETAVRECKPRMVLSSPLRRLPALWLNRIAKSTLVKTMGANVNRLLLAVP
jgi:hypothetical protein